MPWQTSFINYQPQRSASHSAGPHSLGNSPKDLLHLLAHARTACGGPLGLVVPSANRGRGHRPKVEVERSSRSAHTEKGQARQGGRAGDGSEGRNLRFTLSLFPLTKAERDGFGRPQCALRRTTSSLGTRRTSGKPGTSSEPTTSHFNGFSRGRSGGGQLPPFKQEEAEKHRHVGATRKASFIRNAVHLTMSLAGNFCLSSAIAVGPSGPPCCSLSADGSRAFLKN
jgi:hypothetical protein